VPVFDIHTHTTRHSACSGMTPHELIRQAVALRLDGIALTEHETRWDDTELQDLLEAAGGPPLVVINAQEASARDEQGCLEGDFLVYGCHRTFQRNVTAARLTEAIHTDGGVVVAAHPFRPGLGAAALMGDRFHDLPVDGAEVLNQNHTLEMSLRAEQLCAKMGIMRFGGSDAHAVHQLGRFVTVFERPIVTEHDFVRELKAGRFSIAARRNGSPSEHVGPGVTEQQWTIVPPRARTPVLKSGL